MIDGKSVLAIIPARGGSKGLPGKNIKMLCGKPLIAWTIEEALKCNYIDNLIVSTDDLEIAELALKLGADVPFKRPIELSTDTSISIDVIYHAVDWFRDRQTDFDVVLWLQPTSPLRQAADMNNAFEQYVNLKAKAIVSVCEVSTHPWWMNTLPENLNMQGFLRPEVINTNRQTLPTFYQLNGAIYLSDIDYLKQNHSFFGKETYAFIMPSERSIDVDTLIEFKLCEVLLTVENETKYTT